MATLIRYLVNLSSQALREGVLPWEFKPTTPIPEEVRGDKKKRDAWINRPDTNHYVYNGNEGVNAGLRISSGKPDGSGNPVHSSKLLVADIDHKLTKELVFTIAKGLLYPPNWIEETLSGNWRFVWILEELIVWPRHEFFGHFMQNFPKFAFAIDAPGFDQGAWVAPERMYTNSCNWTFIHSNPVPADVVKGWLVQASATFGFEKLDAVIPLDVVKEELKKKFPRFETEWTSDFVLGAMGPSFFVEGSESPKSATVRETGMQTFAAHATKSFYTWRELLGEDFVRNYEAEAMGRAVAGIHYDLKNYYRQNPSGEWKAYDEGAIRGHLTVTRNVSQKVGKDGKSQLSKAIQYIHDYGDVNGAAPVWASPPGIVDMNGEKVLNTSANNIMKPASGKSIWGKDGQFPWLSEFLDTLFSSPEQLEYFLAWLTHYYRCAFDLKPRSGQHVFLVGGVGVGKTFLTRGVVGALVGGFAESKEYLMGKDQFGSELFSKGLWTIDDGSIATNPATHRTFSEMIKRMAANKSFRYHAKFRIPTIVDWLGRIMITCNADENSIRIIPDLDISILDKISIFRTVKSRPKGYFPAPEEMGKILQRELPWLARWLLDHVIPEHLLGESRFGVKPYHEASVVKRAQQSSDNAAFTEILEDWRREYFEISNLKADFWEGSSVQLHKDIIARGAESAMRNFSVQAVGRHLTDLKNKGITYIEILEGARVRKYRIYREDQPTSKQ